MGTQLTPDRLAPDRLTPDSLWAMRDMAATHDFGGRDLAEWFVAAVRHIAWIEKELREIVNPTEGTEA